MKELNNEEASFINHCIRRFIERKYNNVETENPEGFVEIVKQDENKQVVLEKWSIDDYFKYLKDLQESIKNKIQ